MLTVGADGASAHVDLPIHVAPGRHPAVVIIDDAIVVDDAVDWAARTYGAIQDATFERPPQQP